MYTNQNHSNIYRTEYDSVLASEPARHNLLGITASKLKMHNNPKELISMESER
jgi:hypothetical protein